MEALLTNPEFWAAVIGVVLTVLGWLTRKAIRYLHIGWAERYLSLMGNHAVHAVHTAKNAALDQLREAKTESSDGGVAVTDAERTAILDAAKSAFWGAISVRDLSRTLAATGQRWTEDEATEFGNEVLANMVAAEVPAVVPTSGRPS